MFAELTVQNKSSKEHLSSPPRCSRAAPAARTRATTAARSESAADEAAADEVEGPDEVLLAVGAGRGGRRGGALTDLLRPPSQQNGVSSWMHAKFYIRGGRNRSQMAEGVDCSRASHCPWPCLLSNMHHYALKMQFYALQCNVCGYVHIN